MKAMVAGLAWLLGGCASLGSPNPASPYYAYSPGWVARLERPLTIPRDAATVRLQYGEVVPRNSVQEHDPYCVVELNTVRAEPQVLQPGRFEVWRVTRSVETLAATASPFLKTRYAFDDTGPSFLYYKTEFHLRDPAQPDLRSLTCAWDQMAPGNRALMRHLALDEIRSALGDWIALIPPGESL
ncbi:MAG: hypothetical protein B7X93_00750 [Hydrogenophilales bacterium 17-61-9]|nr:MAG: hypothetical protein B7X93_00750 [Hydrogenophilales bacterium 17-61-9]